MCKISVVVPTRNRAVYLEKLFSSLTKQTIDMDDYEIILIDNGSADETRSVCRRWGEKFLNFKYIFADCPGLHTGRNIGYRKSRSEILVFADDDIVATDTWLEAIVDGFQRHPEAVLIGGNDIPQFEEEPPCWVETLWSTGDERILIDYSCILMGDKEKEINPYYVLGCNFAVRKWVLDKTHGFHPDGMPDELLCYRGDGESFVSQYIIQNDLKAFFIPEASVYHCISKQRMTFGYIARVAYRSGITYAYTMLREGKRAVLRREIRREKFGFGFAGKRLSDMERMKKMEFLHGKEFLYKSYQSWEDVREWIHRNDYLGENGKVPVLRIEV